MDAKSLIPESHADLLTWEARTVATVATVGPNGEPQNNPVWFEWDGTHINFSLTTARQKFHNLDRENRIAITVIDPMDMYRYLEIRGELDSVEHDPDIDFISRMAKKYLGKDRYPWHQATDTRVVMRIRPTKVSTMG